MPSITGRLEITLSVRDPQRSAAWYLVGHAANPGEAFNENRTGLDHLEFVVAQRVDLTEWAARLDEMGVAHSGVKELDYTANSMLTFRDPDNIQLEFFRRAPFSSSLSGG